LKNLTWNQSWINPYESGLSIFEKIKYSNVVTSRILVDEFGIKNTNGRFIRQRNSLLNFGEFNIEYLTQSIGFNAAEHTRHYLLKMLGVFSKNSKSACLIRSELTYCDECLSMGYHSLFHQFILLHKCPFHLSNLRSGCNNCQHKLPFRTLSHRNIGGFQCNCSQPVVELKFKSMTEWCTDYPIKDEVLLSWLELNSENVKQFKDTYIYLPNLINQPDALFFLLDFIKFNSFK
jgi:hypothetical protein